MGLFRTDHQALSDERLMELIVRGDERAFGALYDRSAALAFWVTAGLAVAAAALVSVVAPRQVEAG